MAKSKYKMTGFSRFLIFLVFFLPVAYVGASYYNGEDGIGKIKEIFNIEQTQKSETSTTSQCDQLLDEKDREIERLKSTIIRMNEANN